jgi:hypothetical protein
MRVNTAALLRTIQFLPPNWTEFPERLTLEPDDLNMCLVFKYCVDDDLLPATLLYGHPRFCREEYLQGMSTKVAMEAGIMRDDPFVDVNLGVD